MEHVIDAVPAPVKLPSDKRQSSCRRASGHCTWMRRQRRPTPCTRLYSTCGAPTRSSAFSWTPNAPETTASCKSWRSTARSCHLPSYLCALLEVVLWYAQTQDLAISTCILMCVLTYTLCDTNENRRNRSWVGKILLLYTHQMVSF